jgi:poly(3-hydroxybutyrate) depolymerase
MCYTSCLWQGLITALAVLGCAGQSTKQISIRRQVSSGCGTLAALNVGTRTILTLEGLGRPYTVWLPPKYSSDRAWPLIVSLHGASRDSAWQADLDRLTDPYFNTDHILVYPQSTGTGPERYWQGHPGLRVDDVGYILSVLDKVQSQFCVDTSRVYAAGKSQGGMMTNNLACSPAASTRFAAFAMVSGSYYVETGKGVCHPETVAKECTPGRSKIPVLAFHGEKDGTIPFFGGPKRGACLPSIPHWVQQWALRDGLPSAPSVALRISSDATMYVYGQGPDTGLLRFVNAGRNVDHDWMATFPNTDSISHGSGPATFNASSIIMDFFRSYTLR